MTEMAKMQLEEAKKDCKLEEEIKFMLILKIRRQECVVEIQAGTGGDRLSIFAEDFSYVHEIL
jgi:protein subunit release factor A